MVITAEITDEHQTKENPDEIFKATVFSKPSEGTDVNISPKHADNVKFHSHLKRSRMCCKYG